MLPMNSHSRAPSLTPAVTLVMTLISVLGLTGPAAEAASGDSWNVSVTPYMWFTELDGTSGINSPPLPTADVNVPFYKVWTPLTWA